MTALRPSRRYSITCVLELADYRAQRTNIWCSDGSRAHEGNLSLLQPLLERGAICRSCCPYGSLLYSNIHRPAPSNQELVASLDRSYSAFLSFTFGNTDEETRSLPCSTTKKLHDSPRFHDTPPQDLQAEITGDNFECGTHSREDNRHPGML